ncbi:PEP/pyruvate-binding domain-containing protein [Paenibacillus tarimensis]|nr:PEP/pyruvate-binding domain-containing protein [Paenibacillus tarimensis]
MSKSAEECPTWLVIPLAEISEKDISRVGMKAYRLGCLLRAGFPVPEGYVVTSEARQSREQLLSALPAMFGGRLDRLSVAVRSSGFSEDSSAHSYAGMYQTFLRVEGAAAVLAAIEACFAAADRVAESNVYGQHSDFGCAVIVQAMVSAETAGVAFTLNPVTMREETVINAGTGTGERTVDGSITPEAWTVTEDGHARLTYGTEILNAALANRIASLAKAVERFFGEPQDIEWAWKGGELFLLQARPVTAKPDDELAAPGAGWNRDPIHYPYPLCPAFRWDLQALEEASRSIFDENGIMLEKIEAREINGWPYFRDFPLADGEEVAIRDGYVQRLKKSLRVVRTDKLYQDTESWRREWKPLWMQRIAGYRGVSLGELSDTQLAGHLEEIKQFIQESKRMHLRMNYPFAVFVGEFVLACRQWLDWTDDKCLTMLQGTSTMSSEPARELARLGRIAGKRSRTADLLRRLGPGTLSMLQAQDVFFYGELERYRNSFGLRTLGYEVLEKTVAEMPELLLRLVRSQLLNQVDEDGMNNSVQVMQEARALLAGQSMEIRGRFEKLLGRALDVYGLREENGYYTVGAPLALMRFALLEAGRRLSARNQVEKASDVFFLEMEEILQALGHSGMDCRSAAAARFCRRQAALKHAPFLREHPPIGYDGDQDVPSFERFPVEVRSYFSSIHWFVTRDEGKVAELPMAGEQMESAIARGIPACSGVYTGTARIIHSEGDFHRLHEGDVLVCRTLPPGWSMLFPAAGALVTDIGGVLSHAAIIAREFGIPAVMATGCGSRVIKDGQRITVDGLTGAVRAESS